MSSSEINPAAPLETLPDEEFKPRKGSFLFSRIISGLWLSLFLGGAAAAACRFFQLSLFTGLALGVIFFILFIYLSVVAYRKERYRLAQHHILLHRGTLFSDQLTEVDICNITHVSMRLPWLRHKFFNIGTIKIYSAGTKHPITFRSIRETSRIFEQIHERMQRNGYQIEQKELLHEESPPIIGALRHVAQILVSIVGLLFFILPALIGLYDFMVELSLQWLLIALAGGFILYLIAQCFIIMKGVLKRKYCVYDDVVTYEEGFLTKVHAFIPYENISDVSVKRTFVDQLLNLYEVVISCQGSAKEIKFQFLKHGVQLSQSVQTLIAEANLKPSPTGQMQVPDSASSFTTRKEPELPSQENAWIADLKMHGPRFFLPLLILIPLFPVWIILMVRALIIYSSTTYGVRPAFLAHSFRFLNVVEREFAYDKITGLIIKENLFDRLFGTFTLRFWSIGSNESLELAYLKRKDVDLDALLRQIGIPTEYQHIHTVPTKFSLLSWLRANVGSWIAAIILIGTSVALDVYFSEDFIYSIATIVAASIITIALLGYIYSWLFYSRQELNLHDHHIKVSQGVIARRTYYARYKNVKKTLTTIYPGGTQGSLKIFIAGEQAIAALKVEKNQQQQRAVTKPCSFSLGFIPDAIDKSQLLDDVLAGRLEVGDQVHTPEPLAFVDESKRGTCNALIRLILLSILLFPLLPFLLITIPLTIISTKRWRYRLEAGRIVSSWGLIFKKRESILLDRVDSQEQKQGFIGKLFKNGTLNIMTAGSSNPDLIIKDTPSYQTISKEIKKMTQRNG